MITPNTAYVIPFETTVAGVPTAADATPTAVLWRNGSAEVTSVVIVTTANTGIYHASFTTGAGWAETDRIWLVVSATIATVAYRSIVWDSFGDTAGVARQSTADTYYSNIFGLIAVVLNETTSTLTKLGGISFLKNWLAAIMGKSADATTLAEINATAAGATYSNVTRSIQALGDAVDAAQTGDWSITRTFQVASGDKVSGVRMSLVGVDGKTDTTGTDGIATIKADDGTFTLRVVVPAGYEDVADSSVTISGADSTATVTLVATTVTPPTNPLMSRLDVLCLNAAGEAEAGVEVDARIVTVPSGSTNTAFKGNKQTATSGVDGIATFEAPKGAKYQIKRGTAADWQTITIGSTDVTTISSFIGSP